LRDFKVAFATTLLFQGHNQQLYSHKSHLLHSHTTPPSFQTHRSCTPPPDTPEASHSASASPAPSLSPQTPPNMHGPRIVGVTLAESGPVGAPVIFSYASTSTKPKAIAPGVAPWLFPPQNPKSAHGRFAYATRAVWQPNRPCSLPSPPAP